MSMPGYVVSILPRRIMKRGEFQDGALFVWVKRGSPPQKEAIAKTCKSLQERHQTVPVTVHHNWTLTSEAF